MLLLLEGVDFWLDILVLDLALAAEVVDVGELVDKDGVLAIKGDAVKLLASGESLLGGLVLDERITITALDRWSL